MPKDKPLGIWWVVFIVSTVIGIVTGAVSAVATEKACDEIVITSLICHPEGDDPLAEVVTLENHGRQTVDMDGWKLCDSQKKNCFVFEDFEFAGESSMAIWTGGGVNTKDNLYWNSKMPVWNNAGDTAHLYDDEERLVHERECSIVRVTPKVTPDGCCRICGENSKPCGDSCISLDMECHKDPGCACDEQ
ncbi:MAG: lamin tail domain-containing protein [Anaerolineales bacterium]